MNKNVIPNDIPTDNIVVISPHDDFIKSRLSIDQIYKVNDGTVQLMDL